MANEFDNTELNRLQMAMNDYPEINGVRDPIRRLLDVAGLLDNGPAASQTSLNKAERLIADAEDEASSAESYAANAAEKAAQAREILEGLLIEPERKKSDAIT